MLKKQVGYSFLELMVVITIIAIAAMMVVPNLMGRRSGAKLRGAVGNLTADFRLAKQMAVRESALVVIDFSANAYELFVDNGAGGNNGNWLRDADEQLVKNRQLPAGVAIDIDATDFNGSDRTRFNDRGMVDPNRVGKVVLVNSAGDQRQIQLNRLGRLTVQ